MASDPSTTASDARQDDRPHLPQGLTAEAYELIIGSAATRFVAYLVAGLRWMNGEGHRDPVVDPLLHEILSRLIPHIWEAPPVVAITSWMATIHAEGLREIYRRYRDGKIETRADLRDVVDKYFQGFDVQLLPGQLNYLAPSRSAMKTKGRQGPSEYADFALGKLNGLHGTTFAKMRAKSEERPVIDREDLPPPPYGIELSVEEVRAFFNRHLDRILDPSLPSESLRKFFDARQNADRLAADAARRIGERPPVRAYASDESERERREAAEARARSEKGIRSGGRPKRRST